MQKTQYVNYYATVDGHVVSTKTATPRRLKPGTSSPYGHQTVTICIGGKGKSVSVHKLIWEAFNGPVPDGLEIDHIDRNPKNNKLCNLRVCTRMQNARNNSGHRKSVSKHVGVTFHKRMQKWQATIRVNKQLLHLGYFTSEDAANTCRIRAAEKYFAEFAP